MAVYDPVSEPYSGPSTLFYWSKPTQIQEAGTQIPPLERRSIKDFAALFFSGLFFFCRIVLKLP